MHLGVPPGRVVPRKILPGRLKRRRDKLTKDVTREMVMGRTPEHLWQSPKDYSPDVLSIEEAGNIGAFTDWMLANKLEKDPDAVAAMAQNIARDPMHAQRASPEMLRAIEDAGDDASVVVQIVQQNHLPGLVEALERQHDAVLNEAVRRFFSEPPDVRKLRREAYGANYRRGQLAARLREIDTTDPANKQWVENATAAMVKEEDFHKTAIELIQGKGFPAGGPEDPGKLPEGMFTLPGTRGRETLMSELDPTEAVPPRQRSLSIAGAGDPEPTGLPPFRPGEMPEPHGGTLPTGMEPPPQAIPAGKPASLKPPSPKSPGKVTFVFPKRMTAREINNVNQRINNAIYTATGQKADTAALREVSKAWKKMIAETPGLEPLARANRDINALEEQFADRIQAVLGSKLNLRNPDVRKFKPEEFEERARQALGTSWSDPGQKTEHLRDMAGTRPEIRDAMLGGELARRFESSPSFTLPRSGGLWAWGSSALRHGLPIRAHAAARTFQHPMLGARMSGTAPKAAEGLRDPIMEGRMDDQENDQ